MQTHSFLTQKTARYCTIGNLTEETKQVWFACHGYGQLAPFFAKKFEILDNAQHFVVVPEALSRFYLEGFSGRVGATWMTKEERLDDIKDYIYYLDSLYAEILKHTNKEKVKINILGFSQGAATVSRWVAHNKIHFHRLILWAGVFPPDLSFDLGQNTLLKKQIEIVYGLQDEFISEDKIKVQEEQLHNIKLTFNVHTYQGNHSIDPEMLLKLANL